MVLRANRRIMLSTPRQSVGISALNSVNDLSVKFLAVSLAASLSTAVIPATGHSVHRHKVPLNFPLLAT